MRTAASERKVYVELKPRTPFEPKTFRTAIANAGQRAEAFELLLCATIEVQDGRYYLRPTGITQKFAATGAGTTRKLEGLAGTQVCARGKLVSTGPPLALEIVEFAELAPNPAPKPPGK